MKDSKFYDNWFHNLPWKTQQEVIDNDLADIFRDEGGFIDNTGEWWEEAYEVATEPEEYWLEMDPEWKDSIYRKYSDQSDSTPNINENKMKEFDYKAYVADNWLLKEAQDPATAADLEGNWEGSVGKYVEDHKSEIDDAFRNGNLRAYIVTTMKPALSPESQEYVEDTLLKGYANNKQLYMALYNATLKKIGPGLHEQEDDSENFEDSLEMFAQGLSDLLWNCNAPVREDNFKYPSGNKYPYGRIAVKFPDGARFFLGNESEYDSESPVLAFHNRWVPATEQEAAKYGDMDYEDYFKLVVTLLDPGDTMTF